MRFVSRRVDVELMVGEVMGWAEYICNVAYQSLLPLLTDRMFDLTVSQTVSDAMN